LVADVDSSSACVIGASDTESSTDITMNSGLMFMVDIPFECER
jgi:hypothetical protein